MTSGDERATPVEALHRKLRAVAAMLRDPAATAHEKATAEKLKTLLEEQVRRAGAPAGDWTDVAYRLGRTMRGATQAEPAEAPKTDWTGRVYRLGRLIRRGLDKRQGK